LQLCSVAFDAGETTAQPNTPRKLSTSRRKMAWRILSAQALVDLGNSFVVRGQPALAEKISLPGVDLAQGPRPGGMKPERAFTRKLRDQQTIR